MIINYESLIKEAETFLSKEQSVVLATSADNKVTARIMSHVNDGLDIYFQTGSTSEKYNQIEKNKLIALAVGNIQIEAIAEICGSPAENPLFLNLYKQISKNSRVILNCIQTAKMKSL